MLRKICNKHFFFECHTRQVELVQFHTCFPLYTLTMADASTEPSDSMFKPLVDSAEGAAAVAMEGSEPADTAAVPDDRAPKVDALTGVTSLPSLCMACEEQGETRLLLTKIPFFRDVILMAFSCPHCGYRSSEVQSAEFQPYGARYSVTVADAQDLNRQVIKSNNGVVTVPEMDFEIPSTTQSGVFTTIEGMLTTSADALEADQPVRRATDPASAAAVDTFIQRLRDAADGATLPFTFVMDDPTGNSFVENPVAPKPDPHMKVVQYTRSAAQNAALGMYAENAGSGVQEEDRERAERFAYSGAMIGSKAGSSADTDAWRQHHGALIRGHTSRDKATLDARAAAAAAAGQHARAGVASDSAGGMAGLFFDSSESSNAKEVMRFPVECYSCGEPGETRMCATDVPHFKEIIIMAFSCERCGWRNVEVKAGGAVPDQGTELELKLTPGDDFELDMRRDVIKSDTSSVEIPELEFSMEHGTLGGMYTTVEGLLNLILEKVDESAPFAREATDSATQQQLAVFDEFIQRLKACIAGEREFTLKLVDPMGSCFIWSPYNNDETGEKGEDPRLTETLYTRTQEEDLSLGLLDMKTEHYQELQAVPEAEAEDEAAEPEVDA